MYNHPLAMRMCAWNNKPIIHLTQNTLYDNITTDKMKKYWVGKEQVLEDLIENINYKALSKCMKASDFTKRRFITKWASNINANGYNMIKWNKRHKGNCPFCSDDKEDNNHILLCQHKDATTIWKTTVKKLLKQLNKLDTCWYIKADLKREKRIKSVEETTAV